MKRYFLIPIMILIIGITSCSPVTTSLEARTLGVTLGQFTTTVDADAEAEVDAEELPAAPVKDVTPAIPSEEDPTPDDPVPPTTPIITEAHQGFTYRPGQVVTVLAEGFEEGDTLVITLIHETQGQINTFSVSPVSFLGNIPIYLPVEIAEANRYPDGEYMLVVLGSDRTRKSYTFNLDFLNPAEPASFEGCGVYPEPVLGSIVFIWCTGYEQSATPLEIRGVVNGEELFSDVVDTIYSDGVALYVLDIFDDDPAGEWTLAIGQDELTMDVQGEIHE